MGFDDPKKPRIFTKSTKNKQNVTQKAPIFFCAPSGRDYSDVSTCDRLSQFLPLETINPLQFLKTKLVPKSWNMEANCRLHFSLSSKQFAIKNQKYLVTLLL